MWQTQHGQGGCVADQEVQNIGADRGRALIKAEYKGFLPGWWQQWLLVSLAATLAPAPRAYTIILIHHTLQNILVVCRQRYNGNVTDSTELAAIVQVLVF
jgi:hypothetical protein